jgi:cell division protein FtsI (penicillin-binding protein 3)
MDPHTGEILAMGSVPSFDSNDPSSFPMEARRNRVITDPFEPGSVLKPFVVARALEDKVVGMNSRIPTYGGKITVGRKVITEAEEKHRFESVSIVDLIRLSSNVGSVVLGQKLGWSKIEDTYRSLGFGAQTGIDLAGESRGIFNSPRANQLLEKATMTFGQGISLTMLQVAQAYAVIANGGVRVRPHILRAVHGPGDLDLNAPLSIAGTRVFTAQTTEKMKAILEKVVENEGTGILAKVDGFRVAGKTGTSQKVDYKLGGYEKGAYWSQFTGFIPSDKPKYVISVMIDSPRKKGYYGGVVAAPAFSKIAQAAIRLGQNEPPFVLSSSKDTKSTIKEEPTKKSATQELVTNKKAKTNKKVANLSDSKWQSVPTVVGLPLTDALRIMQQKGFSTEIENSGTQVEAQSLEDGTQAEAGQKISLRLR